MSKSPSLLPLVDQLILLHNGNNGELVPEFSTVAVLPSSGHKFIIVGEIMSGYFK